MEMMPLIREVLRQQHPALKLRAIQSKKLTLSSLVFDCLIGEMEFYGEEIDNPVALKVLGLDVEVIKSNDIYISISIK